SHAFADGQPSEVAMIADGVDLRRRIDPCVGHLEYAPPTNMFIRSERLLPEDLVPDRGVDAVGRDETVTLLGPAVREVCDHAIGRLLNTDPLMLEAEVLRAQGRREESTEILAIDAGHRSPVTCAICDEVLVSDQFAITGVGLIVVQQVRHTFELLA